jgi:Zn-dependent peptidase ImmA (M78 family)
MGTKTFEVEVKPEIIKWIIETSGYDIDKLSKKLQLPTKTMELWLEGKKLPTIRQLEKLAKYTKRPLSVFFLPYPPKEKPLPKDYRMLPDEREGVFHRDTLLAIRSARRLQKIAGDLLENLGISPKPNVRYVSLEDDPLEIAKEYRETFGIDEVQKKWRDSYEAFNFLRKKIENLNIFVFQFPMPIEDARGFTLTDEPFVIVINSKEKIEARIFTLAHEFAHVLLRESGIDLPEKSLSLEREETRVEKWCNEFASELLFPRLIATEIFKRNKKTLLKDETLRELCRKYKISKTMLLYNMVKLGYLVKEKYEEIIKNIGFVEEKGFVVPPHERCLTKKGEKFISLVEANLEKGNITYDQALEYLEVKFKYYEKILSLLKG